MPKKQLFRLMLAFLTLTAISGSYLLFTSRQPKDEFSTQNKAYEPANTQKERTDEPKPSEPEIAATSTDTQKITQDQPQTPSKTPFSSENEPVSIVENNSPEELPISITMEINNNSYRLRLKDGAMAYDAMVKLSKENNLSIGFKEFSGLGYFVDEINGQKTDSASGKYWIYYINNKPSQVGISKYLLKNNDLITWKYGIPKI